MELVDALPPWLFYLLNGGLLFGLTSLLSRLAPEGPRPWGWFVVSLVLLSDVTYVLWRWCTLESVVALVFTLAACATQFPEQPMRRLNDVFGKLKFPLYLLAVATVSSLAHIHLPIMTFLTSPGEVGIHLEYLLTTNATQTMVVVYLAAALYGVSSSPRIRTALAAGSLSVLIVFLLYAFVFPFGYPNMNGLMFEQIPVSRETVALRAGLDLVVIALVLTTLLWAIGRNGSKPVLHALVLLNVSLIAASVYNTKTNEVPEEAIEASEVSGPLLRYSKTEQNVLIVVLDRFMGSFIEDIVESEPDLAERLEGFVWYPRSLAAGENSVAGVHPIFGGYDYTPREMNKRGLPLREVANESFAILPHNFRQHGWDVNFVNPRGLGFTMRGDCQYLKVPGVRCLHIPAAVSRQQAASYGIGTQDLAESNYTDLLVLLGTMRGAPYALKAVLNERGPWKPFLHHSAATTFREWAELKALPSLSSTDATAPSLNLFFNTLTHEPYYLGRDCLPKQEMLQASPEEVSERGFRDIYGLRHYQGAHCALRLMADYFDWMRDEGIYDNTQIVLVADHGIVGPVNDTSTRAIEGGAVKNEFVRTRSLMMVKPHGAQGPLSISEAFLPNPEVPRVVCEQLGGCVNPFLEGRTIEAHGRDDPFFVDFVPWQFNLQHPKAFQIDRSIQLRGKDPYNVKGWKVAPVPELP